ncbi:hypothetical protein QFZ79_004191 [Arthrobacter sp. V4I6]|uniref:hypothetical protein n=1 Tax=unclassified Arthrobacter TaxID=235627 RepID=UPI0027832FFE|nr:MULTISPECIES: hypothetical protein [unclassified Arthrobacter]MDQ0821814.1 hypothetical protein [Arthrobacter sp. V1I7]MDQ0856080.1 hypothetical protein [Arthrobacter sp. V4I6]
MASTKDNATGRVFSDDGMTQDSSAETATRRRWPRVAALAAVAAAVVTGGIVAAGNLGSVPAPADGAGRVTPPTAAASLTVTPMPSTAPSVSVPAVAAPSATTAAPAGEWRTFTSADGKVSFDYPAEWSVAAPPGAAGSTALDVDVSDAAGIVLASLHYGPTGAGLGGRCEGEVPYSVLDSMELALPYNTGAADTITPRFAFRALQEPDRVTASYGITGSVAGKDGKSCMFYNVVSGPAESPLYSFADTVQVNAGGAGEIGNRMGAKTFRSLDEARAYMQTPEYLNAKRMITSLKIKAG